MNKWRHHHTLMILLFLVFTAATGFYVFSKQPGNNITSVIVTNIDTTTFPNVVASIDHGRSLTRECIICHTMDEGGPARLGPNLFGIVGSRHAHMKGYAYSKSLAEMTDKIWTPEALDKWLQSPTAYAPGTKMAFPGILDSKEREDIIAYLKTLKNE